MELAMWLACRELSCRGRLRNSAHVCRRSTIPLATMETVVFLALLAAYPTYRVVRHIRKERYFVSEEFLTHKAEIAAVVAEHNEVTEYTSEIRRGGSFSLGASSTGAQVSLASFENTSGWNYKRDRNVANYAAPNVHNCSLQVVRNASADPLKYLMKYFNIKAAEDNLAKVETLGEEISRLENAVSNLAEREQDIAMSINPPAFILKHYNREFMKVEREGDAEPTVRHVQNPGILQVGPAKGFEG